ncbi:hypothetical protein GE09DRAFT_1231760 [Coniochaeta sp. 2T2.1]|nr:hypothetical protein GE09DRAFT_1231760 [Coniochaeta sp. 2T2.1]
MTQCIRNPNQQTHPQASIHNINSHHRHSTSAATPLHRATDLLLACEDLIPLVASPNPTDDDITPEDTERWQRLFSFDPSEAAQQIRDWRSTFGRQTIPTEMWSLMKDQLEGQSYDKETCEYAVATRRFQAPKSHQPLHDTDNHHENHHDDSSSSYLVKLEGPISTPDALKQLASLATTLATLPSTADDGTEAQFCLISGTDKHCILAALAAQHLSFSPTFLRDNKAAKPPLPALPIPDARYRHYTPAGTLCLPTVHSRVLSLDQPPVYRKARVRGGRLTTWGGKYKALVDAGERDIVEGMAYLVRSEEDEGALRYYETERYEVVRCEIEMQDENGQEVERVMGCTFRFVG